MMAVISNRYIFFCLSGISPSTLACWTWWRNHINSALLLAVPDTKQKIFKPKFPALCNRSCYRDITDEDFWRQFPKNLNCPGKPSINHVELQNLANSLDFGDDSQLLKVINWIKNGVEIGCSGRFRAASAAKNTNGSYAVAPQVTDAVAAWVEEGFAYGPVEEHELPAGAKINSILTRPKPNGSVRIILNLSAPVGCSVNEGIDISQFPATMSSTEAWLQVLNKAGKECWMAKVDWANAYKHLVVAEKDTNLQWFEWAGRYFKELCLIFGGSSSAGIFDATAKVVLELVCRLAKFDKRMVCQHLDDVCVAGPAHSDNVQNFDAAFQRVADRIGVKLAPRDDPDKSFGPSKRGVVFGVLYNTEDWTWAIPEDKWIRLCKLLEATMDSQTISATEAKSLVGKLINIKPLIPTGKFNISEVMLLGASANRQALGSARLAVPAECKRQLAFWRLMLLACPGFVSIPCAVTDARPWAINAYCDAAGGSMDAVGRGTGGVCGAWWYYYPWAKRVCAGGWTVDGMKVGRKLSALELVGPLIFIVAGAALFRGQQLDVWVDNAGSVAIWRKGYSNHCRLSTTIVTAISAVCAAIGCSLNILKITRCSSTGAVLADALSKAQFQKFRDTAVLHDWPLDVSPAVIPGALLAWLDKPVPDPDLGNALLRDLATTESILGYSFP